MTKKAMQNYTRAVTNAPVHKVLRKHKKQWMAISISLLMSFGIGMLDSHNTRVLADVNANKPAVTRPVNSGNGNQGSVTSTSSQNALPASSNQKSVASSTNQSSNITSAVNNSAKSVVSQIRNNASNVTNNQNSTSSVVNNNRAQAQSSNSVVPKQSTSMSTQSNTQSVAQKSISSNQSINSVSNTKGSNINKVSQVTSNVQHTVGALKPVASSSVSKVGKNSSASTSSQAQPHFNNAYEAYMQKMSSIDARVALNQGEQPFNTTPTTSNQDSTTIKSSLASQSAQQSQALPLNQQHGHMLGDMSGGDQMILHFINQNGEDISQQDIVDGNDGSTIAQIGGMVLYPNGFSCDDSNSVENIVFQSGVSSADVYGTTSNPSTPSNPTPSPSPSTPSTSTGNGSNSNQDTAYITYNYNGMNIGSVTLTGSDETDAMPQIQSNCPNGYHLVNPPETWNFWNDNYTHQASASFDVAPNEETDNITYQVDTSELNGYVGQTTWSDAVQLTGDGNSDISPSDYTNIPNHYRLEMNPFLTYDGGSHVVNIVPSDVTQTINYQLASDATGDQKFPQGATATITAPYETTWDGDNQGQPENDYTGQNYNGNFSDVPAHFHVASDNQNIVMSDGSTNVTVEPDMITQNIHYIQTPSDEPQGYKYVGQTGKIGNSYVIYGKYGMPIDSSQLSNNSDLNDPNSKLQYYHVMSDESKNPTLVYDVSNNTNASDNTADGDINNGQYDEGEQNVYIAPSSEIQTINYTLDNNYTNDPTDSSKTYESKYTPQSTIIIQPYATEYDGNNQGQPNSDYTGQNYNGSFQNVQNHFHVTQQNQTVDDFANSTDVSVTPDAITQNIHYVQTPNNEPQGYKYVGNTGDIGNVFTIYGQYGTPINSDQLENNSTLTDPSTILKYYHVINDSSINPKLFYDVVQDNNYTSALSADKNNGQDDEGEQEVYITPSNETQTINYTLDNNYTDDPNDKSRTYEAKYTPQSTTIVQPYATEYDGNNQGQPSNDYTGKNYNGSFANVQNHFHVTQPNQTLDDFANSSNISVTPDAITQNIHYVQTPSNEPKGYKYVGQTGKIGNTYTTYGAYGTPISNSQLANNPTLIDPKTILQYYHVIQDSSINPNLIYDVVNDTNYTSPQATDINNGQDDEGEQEVYITPSNENQTIQYVLDNAYTTTPGDRTKTYEEKFTPSSTIINQPYETVYYGNNQGQPNNDYSGKSYNGQFANVQDHYHVSQQNQTLVDGADTSNIPVTPDMVLQNLKYMQTKQYAPANYVGKMGLIGHSYVTTGHYGTPIDNDVVTKNSEFKEPNNILQYYHTVSSTPNLIYDVTHAQGDNGITDIDNKDNTSVGDEGEQNVDVTPSKVTETAHYIMDKSNAPKNYVGQTGQLGQKDLTGLYETKLLQPDYLGVPNWYHVLGKPQNVYDTKPFDADITPDDVTDTLNYTLSGSNVPANYIGKQGQLGQKVVPGKYECQVQPSDMTNVPKGYHVVGTPRVIEMNQSHGVAITPDMENIQLTYKDTDPKGIIEETKKPTQVSTFSAPYDTKVPDVTTKAGVPNSYKLKKKQNKSYVVKLNNNQKSLKITGKKHKVNVTYQTPSGEKLMGASHNKVVTGKTGTKIQLDVPQGYHTTDNINYRVNANQTQSHTMHVDGNHVKGNASITLEYKNANGVIVKKVTKHVPINNYIGRKATRVNPKRYRAKGYKSVSSTWSIPMTHKIARYDNNTNYNPSHTFVYKQKVNRPHNNKRTNLKRTYQKPITKVVYKRNNHGKLVPKKIKITKQIQPSTTKQPTYVNHKYTTTPTTTYPTQSTQTTSPVATPSTSPSYNANSQQDITNYQPTTTTNQVPETTQNNVNTGNNNVAQANAPIDNTNNEENTGEQGSQPASADTSNDSQSSTTLNLGNGISLAMVSPNTIILTINGQAITVPIRDIHDINGQAVVITSSGQKIPLKTSYNGLMDKLNSMLQNM